MAKEKSFLLQKIAQKSSIGDMLTWILTKNVVSPQKKLGQQLAAAKDDGIKLLIYILI